MNKILLKKLIDVGVVERGDFNLSAGGNSNAYINIKRSYGDPELLYTLSLELRKIMNPKSNCVAAGGYGGIPLAVLMSAEYNLKLILVRGESKGYGTNNILEGYIPNEDDRVSIVDDVLTTGKNVKQILSSLDQTGAKIEELLVTTQRRKVELGIPVSFLFTLEDFLFN